MPTVAVLGTLDTKGPEIAFLAQQVRARWNSLALPIPPTPITMASYLIKARHWKTRTRVTP